MEKLMFMTELHTTELMKLNKIVKKINKSNIMMRKRHDELNDKLDILINDQKELLSVINNLGLIHFPS